MKKSFLAVVLFTNFVVFAQLGRTGINIRTPNATLEVVGQPTTTTEMDGVIVPKITGDQLFAKTYSAAQNGAIVYVTAAASPANLTGQTVNVSQRAYYFFDGAILKWVRLLNNYDRIPSNIFSAETTANGSTTSGTNVPMVYDKINLNAPMPAGYGWNWNGNNNSYKIYNPGIYAIAGGAGIYNVDNTSTTALGAYSFQIVVSGGTSSYSISDGTKIANTSYPVGDPLRERRISNGNLVGLYKKDDVITLYFAKSPSQTLNIGQLSAGSFIHIVYTPL